MSTVITTTEALRGIAFDPTQKKLYWSSTNGKIYRGNLNGSDIETVLSSSECKYKKIMPTPKL